MSQPQKQYKIISTFLSLFDLASVVRPRKVSMTSGTAPINAESSLAKQTHLQNIYFLS